MLQNEEESSVDEEQRDDTDTQGRGDDAGSVSQSSLDMPFTQHQCRSEGCTACPQAGAEASAANGLPTQVDCDICQDIFYQLEECSSDDCNNQVCVDHLCSTCTSCEDCCDCQEEEESVVSSTASASSEVDADENDSSDEVEDEEDEDQIQHLIDKYPNALIINGQAGIGCRVRRSINRTTITFNSSFTFGTAIGPYLVICAVIYALDLPIDGGGGGRGGTVNCIFPSVQIEELYLSDVNTLKGVQESDPHNVEARSLLRKDDIDIDDASGGAMLMLTKVIDNLRSEMSHNTRGRHYNKPLLNDTINNLTAIRAAIGAGNVPPDFLWENQAEPPLDSNEFLKYIKKLPQKMKSQMELLALHQFFCVNGNLPPRLNPQGGSTDESNFERIKKRAEHGARSEFELFFHDPHYAARFKLYLTEDEQNNPNDIPIERKKELCLTFLHEEGYVAKHFTPITLVPSEDFSLNKLNASEEEKKVFWDEAIPKLFENKERVITELEEREGKLAKLPQHMERTRQLVRQHPEPFEFIESMQHKGSLQEEETLEWFSEELMSLVQDIPGLESLTFDKLSDITQNEFANVGDESNSTRRDKLAELKTTLFGYIDGGVEGQCALCTHKRSEHSHRASMAFENDHPNEKTAGPAQLARKTNGEYRNEILDPDKGLLHTCSGCNDKGTRRKVPLKILKYIRLILGEEGGRDDHKTVLELYRDPTTKLLYQIWEIEAICRGMTSTSFDNCCDFNTIRVAFDAFFSTEGNFHLADDLTRMSAKRYMSDDNGTFRRREIAQITTNLITSDSQSCMGADELVSHEAEQRRENNEALAEKDYVCNKKTVSLTNKAPYDYYSTAGDHEDDKKKKFKPSTAKDKNVFKRIDELCKVAMTCYFCHSIRTWHQRRATSRKLKIQRCFFTIGSQIFKTIGRR